MDYVVSELYSETEQIVQDLPLVQFTYKHRVEYEQIPFDLLHPEIALTLPNSANQSSEPGPSLSNTSSLSQTIQTNMGVIRNFLLDKMQSLVDERPFASNLVAYSTTWDSL